MEEIISQMLWPLLACFILVGIHAYLGIHVIARKVIFVDLALAQIAGLGAVYGIFLGLSFESHNWIIKVISVCFTLLGALLVAITRGRDERIPHEAIIGIIYASALSLTVLLTSNLPHGSEEVQQMLAGSILWVSPEDVAYTALLYGVIGLVHIIFRRQFFQLSNDLALKQEPTNEMRFWDFLFYATFGIVVTSSVSMGGVLLVFGYLVIPAVIGVYVAQSPRARLCVAWGAGIIMSIVGIIWSYFADLPSGPAIVVVLTLLLIIVRLGQHLLSKAGRVSAVWQIAFWGTIVTSLLIIPGVVSSYWAHDCEERHGCHLLEHHIDDPEAQQNVIKNMLLSYNSAEIIKGLNSINEAMNLSFVSEVTNLLQNSDAHVRERAIQVIGQMHWHEAVPQLLKAFKHERDEFIGLEIAETTLSLKSPEGFIMLARIWQRTKSELARADALLHITKWLPDVGLKDAALIKWVEQHYEKLEFDEKIGVYLIK